MTLPDLPDDLWDVSKPPLERWWDASYPDWEPAPPQTQYRIWHADTGLPCACALCGADDHWTLENDAPELQVFVCDHGPVEFMESIRQIDTIAARHVGRFEIASEFDG